MSDGPPNEDKAVASFLDYLALACIFGGVDECIAAKWVIAGAAFGAGTVFHIVGIKWERIRRHLDSQFDWQVWEKRLANALRLALSVVLIAVIAATGYAVRTIFRATSSLIKQSQAEFHAPIESANPNRNEDNAPSLQPEKKVEHPSQIHGKRTVRESAGPASPVEETPPTAPEPITTHKEVTKTAEPLVRVDWHDKQNWRKYLHTGMTRSDIRILFGDPTQMSVVSTSEFWNYGYGEIQFQMDGHPDGSLYAWFEPR